MKFFRSFIIIDWIVLAVVIGAASFLIFFTSCSTTDKAVATGTQTALATFRTYVDWYHVSTNQHPEKSATLTQGLTNAMKFARNFGVASEEYRRLSEFYATNNSVSNLLSRQLEAVNYQSSNLLWAIKFYKNQF